MLFSLRAGYYTTTPVTQQQFLENQLLIDAGVDPLDLLAGDGDMAGQCFHIQLIGNLPDPLFLVRVGKGPVISGRQAHGIVEHAEMHN